MGKDDGILWRRPICKRNHGKSNGRWLSARRKRLIPDPACLKHFAGYGAVNAGREYNDVEISQRTFLEQYVKPFRMALKAKPAMVMTAFNAIDRKPISGNKELLKGPLRDKEGFEGTVISDWGSIGQLEEQGVAADMEEAAIRGFRKPV